MWKSILMLLILCYPFVMVQADIASDSEIILDWAEDNYSDLLTPEATTSTINFDNRFWYYRYYSMTQLYVGINDQSEIYIYDGINQQLKYINTLAYYLNKKSESDISSTCKASNVNNASALSGETNDISKQLISSVAGVMQSDYLLLDNCIQTLKAETDNYCASLGKANEADNRSTAQNVFKATMQVMQATAMYNLGPATEDERLYQLYSWPLISTCAIDRNLALNSTTLGSSVYQRGLDSLEYLLFVEPSANSSCADNIVFDPPDLMDNFDALSSSEKQQRRCNYMQMVVDDAVDNAKVLANAWDSSQGNYPQTMLDHTNTLETLNGITDALFYFEQVVKENKLDAPLGGSLTNTSPSCGANVVCPQDVESPNARISLDNLLANMKAMQKIYLGGDPSDTNAVGFDDLLVNVGQTELSERVASDIQRIIDGLQAINTDLYTALENDSATVKALLEGPVQDVSKALRFEILPPLGLSLPAGSQSDTD